MTSRSFLDLILFFFFFNDTATTEIYTLSLHDALPILWRPADGSARSCPTRRHRGCHRRRRSSTCLPRRRCGLVGWEATPACMDACASTRDRKSTRLNSSHDQISYAVFCLKKKNNKGRKVLPAAPGQHQTGAERLRPARFYKRTRTRGH